MQTVLIYLALGTVALTLVAILWSVAFPQLRLWPPKNYTALTPVIVWVPTFALFGILFILGIKGWGDFSIPSWLRFGVGLPLILIGNIIVWLEVSHFGVPQTGGAKGSLRTQGMYRYSRNPQYLADIAIVGGWIMLSASHSVLLVGISAIALLIAAPFAEESWLFEQYGQPYKDYASKTRRYF